MGNATTEFVTKEHLDNKFKTFESKIIQSISKEYAKEKERVLDCPATKSDFKGLKAEMLMWMIGILIAFSVLLLTVLNQRINDVNQRIDRLEKGIAENRVLIQKVLDNQNKAN